MGVIEKIRFIKFEPACIKEILENVGISYESWLSEDSGEMEVRLETNNLSSKQKRELQKATGIVNIDGSDYIFFF